MKGRFIFSSGMTPREFESNAASVDELIAQRFGSMFAFQDLGGSVEVYLEQAANPVQEDEPVQEAAAPVVEEVAPAPVKKRKATVEANDK